MEFIEWWFDTHYIASTIFTPALSFAWACWKGLLLRGVAAVLCGGLSVGIFRGVSQ